MAYFFLGMIQRIKDLLRAVPFASFTIRTSDGSAHVVPTADHAAVSPNNTRVFIFGDDESQKMLSGLHIVAIEETQTAR